LNEVTFVGVVAAILAIAGFVWAAIASQRARDDRRRVKRAMQQLAHELSVAEETDLYKLTSPTGPTINPRSESLSSPEEIVARAVELARPLKSSSRVNVHANAG